MRSVAGPFRQIVAQRDGMFSSSWCAYVQRLPPAALLGSLTLCFAPLIISLALPDRHGGGPVSKLLAAPEGIPVGLVEFHWDFALTRVAQEAPDPGTEDPFSSPSDLQRVVSGPECIIASRFSRAEQVDLDVSFAITPKTKKSYIVHG